MAQGIFERPLALVRAALERGEAGAIVLAIADAHETFLLESFCPAQGPRASEDSIFLIASITKPFMATAVLQLAEQGLLLPSDRVSRYIDGFERYGKEKVELWHLLTHTSGLAEEVWEQAWKSRTPADEHLRLAREAFLHFPPGSAYEYCNLSFWPLAQIIGELSGLDYKDYVVQRIARPLGMSDTAFFLSLASCPRLLPVLDMPEDMPLDYFLSLGLPAGGLCSTAADLVRFGQAILRGWKGDGCPILSEAGIRAMTSLQTAGLRERSSGEPALYGLGWGRTARGRTYLGGENAFGHGGATGTLLWIDPDLELVYVFLTNKWGDNRVAWLVLNAVVASLQE